MSDPKHLPKVVIVVRSGVVACVCADKKLDARIFVCDYDAGITVGNGADAQGQLRVLYEINPQVDSMSVRNIFNKKGRS